MSKQRPAKRIIALDGLRGFAAAVVVVRHTSNAIDMPMQARLYLVEGPLALLFNAQGAVQLFFVLSGYVLAVSLNRNRRFVDVLQFYVKRIFRIQLPYLFAISFAWALSFFYIMAPEGHGLTAWVRRSALVQVDLNHFLAAFMFPGRASGLLPVGWTLTVEMVFSFLLPVMVLIVRRSHWILLLGVSCGMFLLGHQFNILWYSIDFTLGIMAFYERDRLSRWASRTPGGIKTLAVIISVIVFTAPLILHWSKPWQGLLLSGFRPLDIAVMGVGSVGLILSALYVPWLNRFLSTRPLNFLGKISFSLYLLHRTVLTLCAPLIVRQAAWWYNSLLLFGVVMGFSIVLSWISYLWVERPSIIVGNRVCLWLSRWTGTESLPSISAEERPE